VTVHALVPAGFGHRPSGGNVYDRQLLAGLRALGRDVVVHEASSAGEVAGVLAGVHRGVLLVDSLVASWSAEALAGANVPVVPLVHMVFGTPGEDELLADAPAVITTSAWTRARLVEHHLLEVDRVHVAVPGVVPDDLPAPGTASGGNLLCVAPLVPAKGQDVLLAALARLTDLDWHLTLVGSASADRDFADELRKAAAEAGTADRVVLAGELAGADLRAAYAGADVLVHPSLAETYGMVVTEALAHGLPVIASAVGGVPEALGRSAEGRLPGLLVAPADPEALASALRSWLERPGLRQRLRETAGSRRESLPDWSGTAEAVAAALEGVS
jgi:glycosyltransferase involved in cell wall biosynthesis